MLVKTGNWLFHYRNILFPLFYAGLFIPSAEIISQDRALSIGAILIFIGILIRCITIGLVYVIRGGHKRTIHADELVTDGIYKVCRNPMYLGNIVVLLGFAFFSNSLLFLLLFFPLFYFIYVAIIKAEEAFLFNKFEENYQHYKFQTNALIPNLYQVENAFTNQSFNLKKVIYEEYNSLFLYSSGILLLLFYHQLLTNRILIFSFLIISIIYLIIKSLKNKNKFKL